MVDLQRPKKASWNSKTKEMPAMRTSLVTCMLNDGKRCTLGDYRIKNGMGHQSTRDFREGSQSH